MISLIVNLILIIVWGLILQGMLVGIVALYEWVRDDIL